VNDRGELLSEARYGLEAEREATVTPRSVGVALIAGGALGLASVFGLPGMKLRERLFAIGGSVTSIGLGAVAVGGPLSLNGPARRAPVQLSLVCYGTAVVSTALGGGHQAPAYFPAVTLTALGAGIGGDVRTGRRGGTAIGFAYLAGCGATLRPWRSPLAREVWWNAAAAFGFVGAGIVGAIAGDLVFKTRALTDYAEREGAADRDTMEGAASEVRRIGQRFLELLPKVDEAFAGSTEMLQATDETATALASLRSARVLDYSEERQNLGTWERLRELADDYNAGGGSAWVTLATDEDPAPAADARTTGVLCDCATALIQNAANVRGERAAPVEVIITLEVQKRARREQLLTMTVEDDAGGGPVPRAEWGRGLTECNATAEELGGRFGLEQGRAGLRAMLVLPYVRSRGSRPTPWALDFVSQARDGRDEALRAMRWVTLAQALCINLSLPRPERAGRRTALIATLFGAGELAQRLPEQRRATAAAALAATAMSSFPGPGRPPLGGWSATMCAQAATSGGTRRAWASAAMAAVGATAVAGPERFGEALPTTIGDRTFTLVGAAIGAGIWQGIEGLRNQEEQVADEAWRRQILAELVSPDRNKHHRLDPLEKAVDHQAWRKFTKTELGSDLSQVREDLVKAQQTLEDLLRGGDPLRELQHQLARLLAPAPVRVLGEWPKWTTPRRGQELDAVRFRLGLIGLGQAIADRVRFHLPSSFFFRERLQELQVHVKPDYELTRFTIVQVPFKAPRYDRVDAILDVASRRAGGRAGPMGSDRFEVLVRNTALS
jgi:two-component sensor histidine kinase